MGGDRVVAKARRGPFVCPTCLTAWRWKSPAQPGAGEELKKRREAWFKTAPPSQAKELQPRPGWIHLDSRFSVHTIEQAQTARKKETSFGRYEGLVRSLLAIFNPYCTVSSQRIGNQAFGSMRHDHASCRARFLVGQFPIHRRPVTAISRLRRRAPIPRALEQVPQELVVDVVVILHLGSLHKRSQ
jgi:hypothetical protein